MRARGCGALQETIIVALRVVEARVPPCRLDRGAEAAPNVVAPIENVARRDVDRSAQHDGLRGGEIEQLRRVVKVKILECVGRVVDRVDFAVEGDVDCRSDESRYVEARQVRSLGDNVVAAHGPRRHQVRIRVLCRDELPANPNKVPISYRARGELGVQGAKGHADASRLDGNVRRELSNDDVRVVYCPVCFAGRVDPVGEKFHGVATNAAFPVRDAQDER